MFNVHKFNPFLNFYKVFTPYKFFRLAPQAGVEPTTTALGEPRSIH